MGNALNEVVNGFEVPDFSQRIGCLKTTKNLMRCIGDAYEAAGKRQDIILEFDLVHVQILVNAINAVLQELDDSDFQTRMGCTPLHMRGLLARLECLR